MKTPVILRVFKSSQLIEVKQFDVDQIIVGNGGDVQLNLVDAGVAPIHCLIELRDSGYYLCDLGSASGTFKNNNQILDEPISSGDSIGIGPFQVQFFVGVPKPKAPPTIVPPAEKKIEEPSQKVEPVAAVVSTVQTPQPPPAPPQSTATIPATKPAEPAGPDRSAGAAQFVATPAPPKLPEQAVRVGKATAGHKNGGDAKSGRKHNKTYAPPSEIRDLRQHLKPTKGGTLEVLVAWKERIFETLHFTENSRILSIGPTKADVTVSNQFVGATQPFVQLAQGVANVNLPAGATIEVITTATRFSQDDLLRTGKAVGTGATLSIKMEQGDLVCVSFGETLHLYLRFVTTPPKPIAASLLDMTGGEATGLIVAVMIVSLLALYTSIYAPVAKEKEEEQVRLAQFVYNKPPEPPKKPEPVPPPPPPTPEPPPQPPPPPKEPQKVKVTEEKKEAQTKGNKNLPQQRAQQAAGRANEVRPNPNATNRPKKFTSTRQGGAVKMSDKDSANANSPKDVTKTGLLSAFGGGGNRAKLDQAYTGAGELLGMGEKATGTSGQNQNREGDDIGSRFKADGAGGKGTATQGIAGIGTRGRGSGQSAYGGVGFGGKGNVTIEAGGSDEEFVGSIDREAVRRVVRSILSQIKSCYERQLRSDSSLGGKVVIQFEIVEQGRVRTAKTKSTTLNNSTVESCVAARIREQRFPEPPAGTFAVVDYPFVFDSQN